MTILTAMGLITLVLSKSCSRHRAPWPDQNDRPTYAYEKTRPGIVNLQSLAILLGPVRTIRRL